MCSNISSLGGTHVQQSFRSRPNIYVPHLPVDSKAVQYFLTLWSTPRGPPARKSSHSTYRFVFPSTVVVVRLFRFHHYFSWKHFFLPVPYSATGWQTVKDTFIDLPADVVPYEIITYGTVCVPDLQCPIYSTPFDVSYVPYEIIHSDSQSKRPISRNSTTFDPDRILKFWIDDWTGNFHAHWFSSRAAVQQSYLQRYFRSS